MVSRALGIKHPVYSEGSIKSQCLVELIDEDPPSEWILSMDDTSDVKGSGARIVLEGPSDIVIEQKLKFEFTASNNQA